MVSVSISHLIGTVALMLIFFSIGSYYSMSIASLKNEVITVQLSKIANYIGSDIEDLVSLCYIGEQDQMLLIKNLTLPTGLTSFGYNMTIEKIGQNMLVRVYLISESEVYGEYILPWPTESNIRVYNGLDPEVENCIYSERPSLTLKLDVDDLDTGIMIWCVKHEDQITIGLGLMN
jgi:hypothetical protein